ncbi:MAG: lysoplasmalogenase [Bacilli bacterium]|nr:lysoplasmalogenase [Bacilli bacterium]
MIILMVICISLALLFTYTDYKNQYKKAVTLKFLSTLSIAFLSFISFNKVNTCSKLYFLLIFLGIICGLIGDTLLALDKVYMRKNKNYFLSGLISFLVGHILYITAFILIMDINKYDFIFAVIYILIAYYIRSKSKLDFNRLEIPILIYALVITLMFGKVTSILLFLNNQPLNILVFIGGLLFIISDSILVFDIFGEKRNELLPIYCHLSYFPAQMMFALSILFM